MLRIRLFCNDWDVVQLEGPGARALQTARRLYQIPADVETADTGILKEMRYRDAGLAAMQTLVQRGMDALRSNDIPEVGKAVRTAWSLKKQWHPSICTPGIQTMCDMAEDVGAWGWKVCGAGGQGYLLVIGDRDCHAVLSQVYTGESFDVVSD